MKRCRSAWTVGSTRSTFGARNAKNLRKAAAAHNEAGRRVKMNTGTRGAPKKAAAPSDRSDLAAIRAWAQENGIPVAARGQIAASVKEQYLAATGG